LLFLDPGESEGISVQQIAEQFARFSREAMAKGILDEIGEQVCEAKLVWQTLTNCAAI